MSGTYRVDYRSDVGDAGFVIVEADDPAAASRAGAIEAHTLCPRATTIFPGEPLLIRNYWRQGASAHVR